MYIAFSYQTPPGFKIRSIADAQRFCNELMGVGSFDTQDLNDPMHYYRVCKERDGRMSIGHARYGKDPILAEPVLMRLDNVPQRIFKARKSINARLFN